MKKLIILLTITVALMFLLSYCTKPVPDNSNPCPEKDKLIEEQSFRITNLSKDNDLLKQNITGLNLQIHILRDRLDNIVPDTVVVYDTTIIHDTTTIIIDNTPVNIDSISFGKIDTVKDKIINYSVKAYLDQDSSLTSFYYINDTLNMKMTTIVDGLKLFNYYKENYK